MDHQTFQHLQHTYLVPKWWPAAASLYYYAFTILLATVLRAISKNVFPRSKVIYILDLISTFQLCACSLENASVRHYHGFSGFLFVVFLQAVIYTLTFKGFTGNPLANVMGYLNKKQTLTKTLLRVAFQVVGGLVSYRYARTMWRFKLNDIHLNRAERLCSNDLRVDPAFGFLVEFAGTIFETFISLCTLSSNRPTDIFIKLTISVINLAFAVELTGYYLNPANATAQTFGCGGSDPWIFIIIYWIGPIIATFGAVFLKNNIKIKNCTPSSLWDAENFLTDSNSNSKPKRE